jgi:hypothetical protein
MNESSHKPLSVDNDLKHLPVTIGGGMQLVAW